MDASGGSPVACPMIFDSRSAKDRRRVFVVVFRDLAADLRFVTGRTSTSVPSTSAWGSLSKTFPFFTFPRTTIDVSLGRLNSQDSSRLESNQRLAAYKAAARATELREVNCIDMPSAIMPHLLPRAYSRSVSVVPILQSSSTSRPGLRLCRGTSGISNTPRTNCRRVRFVASSDCHIRGKAR